MVPGAKLFAKGNQQLMALPHDVDVVRMLYNFGVHVPSPIAYYYGWAGNKPFDSQIRTASLLSVHRRAFVLNEMGTGKTRAALFAYDYLRSIGKASKVLIVAPLSTLVSVWEQEVFENLFHLQTAVLHGDKKRRLKLLAGPADCYVINHEGVAVIRDELAKRPDIDTIIVDELAVYRNARSNRWKALAPLVAKAKYAWGLTGSPTPNEPTDAYGQIKLLTPTNVSYSFKAFRDETMRQITAFRWIARDDANDIVYHRMQPSIRVTRAECFDLPPVTYSARDIPMDPRAAAAYKEMFDKLATTVGAVVAANEGVKLSKLLQLSAGFIYKNDGKATYVGGLARIREVFDIVEEATGKVIVFAPFKFLVELYAKALAKKYETRMIHGEVAKSERDKTFVEFQRGTSVRVLVAHPQTMAHGLTLTAANTIVWAAPTMSLEIYEQANARITRPGQKDHAHIIHIQSSKAEQQVYARLRKKAKMQGALLELFADG